MRNPRFGPLPRNLPNLITMARLLAVPVIVWLILGGRYQSAFWLFVAAGVSDAVDGVLAKRFGMATALGAYLDPIADKALLIGVYLTLGAANQIADWIVILVVFRDLLILGGVVVGQMLGIGTAVQPIMISKLNTLAQIVLAASAMGLLAFRLDGGPALDILQAFVAATTVVSGLAYLYRWVSGASQGGQGQ
ncbi:MAG: CDP-alcohol phosphatidyltransferase family protein [Alphaproteobacteria bacterium]